MHADMEIGAERAVATATAVCVIKCPMTGLSLLSPSLRCFSCRHRASLACPALIHPCPSHHKQLLLLLHARTGESRLLVVGRSLLHDGSLSGSWQVTRIMDL